MIETPYYLIDKAKLLRGAQRTMPMAVTMVSAIALEDPACNDTSPEAEMNKALRVLAQTPAIIAGFHRLRRGEDIISKDLSESKALTEDSAASLLPPISND